jgi:hypothetical protein
MFLSYFGGVGKMGLMPGEFDVFSSLWLGSQNVAQLSFH